jgi:hypothetical protein
MAPGDAPFSRQTIMAAEKFLQMSMGLISTYAFRFRSSPDEVDTALVHRAALEHMRPSRRHRREGVGLARQTFRESLFRDGFSILETGEIAPIPTAEPERYETNVHVFISYRRDDSRYQARDIYRAFCKVITPDQVFMDVDTISPGDNFRKVLNDWVDQCDLLLALIGPGWLDARDPKTKRRRLDNPSDFVRIEIGAALARGIPVVPVLLDGAPIPDSKLLPDDLKGLVDQQAEFVEYRTFDTDVERLIRKLGLS